MDPLPNVMAEYEAQTQGEIERHKMARAALAALLSNPSYQGCPLEQIAHVAVLLADLTLRNLREIKPRV